MKASVVQSPDNYCDGDEASVVQSPDNCCDGNESFGGPESRQYAAPLSRCQVRNE